MFKEIKQISDDGNTVRVTTADERWYIKTLEDGTIVEYPSCTWICSYYPKGPEYIRWVAAQGYENAQAIMEQAGNRGSKVHRAISSLLLGNELRMDEKITNDNGEPEDITVDEWKAIMSFAEWHKSKKPKTLANEITVFNDEHRFAGTVDYICEIGGERWLIDFKTSKSVYPSYEIQLSAYAHSLPDELKPNKIAILQLGYDRNKMGYKFTEIENQFQLFLAAKAIWQKECGNEKIRQKDFPISISL